MTCFWISSWWKFGLNQLHIYNNAEEENKSKRNRSGNRHSEIKEKLKKSQEDCMITNGKKAELKVLWEKELKVYYYVLNLDGLSMFRMQHI